MQKEQKTVSELRFELLVWGIILIAGGVIYITVYKALPSLILFIPGLVLLGAAIYQDMQPDWHAGWLTYALAIIVVATGLGGIVNTLMDGVDLPWVVIALIELGVVLVAKALYDPSPR
nr:hypothetical protein [Anaerolineae bacterium]